MAAHPKVISDMTYPKTIRMDGEKLPGVQSFDINYDIEKAVTIVTIRMTVARESIKIEGNDIEFKTARACNVPEEEVE